MKKYKNRLSCARIASAIICVIVTLLCSPDAYACTSMLVSAKASGTGRPLMWKHRDSDAENSFVERVQAKNGKLGYVALYNAGDSLLQQAWMGMNDAGFAIMNTASYNLAPDTARLKDMEGYIMVGALKVCRTVRDFEVLLLTMAEPRGVQANFGVMDAAGGMAYFETSDYGLKRFDVADSPEGILIRTNYSVTGAPGRGHGYIRESNLREILKDEIAAGNLRPESFTEKASKSFYHSILGYDALATDQDWAVDQDFIPRGISSATIVIEGTAPDQPVSEMMMWTSLGYPPCSFVVPVTLNSVPEVVRPLLPGARSQMAESIAAIKAKVFPLKVGNGPRYINLGILRQIVKKTKEQSMEIYKNAYKSRKK